MMLYLDLPPAKVDANVHPTKAEVRLDGESAIFAGIVHAVRSLSTVGTRGASVPTPPVPVPAPRHEQPGANAYPFWAGNPERVSEAAGGLWQVAQRALPSLRPLGQAGGKWVVCDGPGGVFLVDQHAAHERIQFERLQQVDVPASVAGAAGSAVDTIPGAARQGLAVPAPVDLGPAELSAWHDFRDELELLGMDTESFGGATVLVRTLPAALIHSGSRPGLDPAALLQDVLATLAAEGQGSALAPRLRARRALASCAAAVKASATLSMAEIAALLRDLAVCKEPLRCPHGRPTLVLLANDELDRRFGRS
jgi:DNA mismatch repair protein MutL